MAQRVEAVEKMFLSVLNEIFKTNAITLTYEHSYSSRDIIYLEACRNGDPRQVYVATVWSEWPFTYIICIGERRGKYLFWIKKGNRIRLALLTETTDPKNYLSLKKAVASVEFRQLAQTIFDEYKRRINR
jgi:hypothetical protein